MNKNIIIFVMFLSNIILLNAQTLKFSQIKLIDNNISTVPQNKVWKIESVLSSDPLIPSKGTTDNTYYTINKTIEINGNVVYISRASRYTENSSRYNSESTTGIPIGQTTELPIWLPAGTTLKAGSNALYVNVIEFDIIP